MSTNHRPKGQTAILLVLGILIIQSVLILGIQSWSKSGQKLSKANLESQMLRSRSLSDLDLVMRGFVKELQQRVGEGLNTRIEDIPDLMSPVELESKKSLYKIYGISQGPSASAQSEVTLSDSVWPKSIRIDLQASDQTGINKSYSRIFSVVPVTPSRFAMGIFSQPSSFVLGANRFNANVSIQFDSAVLDSAILKIDPGEGRSTIFHGSFVTNLEGVSEDALFEERNPEEPGLYIEPDADVQFSEIKTGSSGLEQSLIEGFEEVFSPLRQPPKASPNPIYTNIQLYEDSGRCHLIVQEVRRQEGSGSSGFESLASQPESLPESFEVVEILNEDFDLVNDERLSIELRGKARIYGRVESEPARTCLHELNLSVNGPVELINSILESEGLGSSELNQLSIYAPRFEVTANAYSLDEYKTFGELIDEGQDASIEERVFKVTANLISFEEGLVLDPELYTAGAPYFGSFEILGGLFSPQVPIMKSMSDNVYGFDLILNYNEEAMQLNPPAGFQSIVRSENLLAKTIRTWSYDRTELEELSRGF